MVRRDKYYIMKSFGIVKDSTNRKCYRPVYHVSSKGGKLIEERLAELTHQIQATGEPEESFLASLLGDGKLSLEETYGNLTEIMAAAVDTVTLSSD